MLSLKATDPILLDELKCFERLLRPLIRRDQCQWYDKWLAEADEADEAHQGHNAAELYRKLNRLGRRKETLDKGPGPLP